MSGTSRDMTAERTGQEGAVYAVYGDIDAAAADLDGLIASGTTLRRIPTDLLAALDTGSHRLRREALLQLTTGSTANPETGPAATPLRGALSLDDWWTTALEALNPGFALGAARRLVTDKAAMYRRLRRHGVPVPDFIVGPLSTDLISTALQQVGPAPVFKPTTGDASRGVYRYRADLPVQENLDLYRALLHLGHIDSSMPIVATAYLGGGEALEVSAEVVLTDGHVRLLVVHEKYTATRHHPFLDRVMISPPITPAISETQTALAATIDRVADALPMDDGVLHVEMRLHEGVWHVLDIGVRPGAGLIPHSVLAVSGVDLRLVQLLVCLDLTPNLTQPILRTDAGAATCIACCYATPDARSGSNLDRLATFTDELRGSPDVIGWHLNAADTADAVYRPDAGLSIGVTAPNPNAALNRLRELIDAHGFQTT